MVVAVFVAAWFFVESPQVARARRLDQALIQNFYNIESAVNSYYERKESLPEDLSGLLEDKRSYLSLSSLSDPETGAAIVYNKISAEEFELCAEFRTSSFDNSLEGNRYISINENSKEHDVGYQCLRGNLYVNLKMGLD